MPDRTVASPTVACRWFASPCVALPARPRPRPTRAWRATGTPPGWKVEIAATEPLVINPVTMTFGPDGRLYVVEWQAGRGPNDHIKVLTDTDGDGTFDKAEMYMDDLDLPAGVLLLGRLDLRHARPRRRPVQGHGRRRQVRDPRGDRHRVRQRRLAPPRLGHDDRPRRLALPDDRRQRRPRQGLGRLDGDRAPLRRRLPLPARRLEAGERRLRDAEPLGQRRVRRRVPHLPHRQRQRGHARLHRLPAPARRRGGRLRLAAPRRGPLLPARLRARHLERRPSRPPRLDGRDRPRRPGGPLRPELGRLPAQHPQPARLPRRLPQARPRLQAQAHRRDLSRSPRSSSSSPPTRASSARPTPRSGPTAPSTSSTGGPTPAAPASSGQRPGADLPHDLGRDREGAGAADPAARSVHPAVEKDDDALIEALRSDDYGIRREGAFEWIRRARAEARSLDPAKEPDKVIRPSSRIPFFGSNWSTKRESFRLPAAGPRPDDPLADRYR